MSTISAASRAASVPLLPIATLAARARPRRNPVGLAATGAYRAGRALEPDAAQTMAFATIALAVLLFVFSIRSNRTPAWRGPRNAVLAASALAPALALAATIYFGPLRELFGTHALDAPELLIVAALAAVPAAAAETTKALGRRTRGSVLGRNRDRRLSRFDRPRRAPRSQP